MLVCKACNTEVSEGEAVFAQPPIDVTSQGDEGDEYVYGMPAAFHPEHLDGFLRSHPKWREGKDN